MARPLPRTISPVLQRAARERPALLVTGPRQAGKTTLLRELFGNERRYVTLDDPAARRLAIDDPTLFLEEHAPPVIIDEIQYAPALLPSIKLAIDRDRSRAGQFLLTGSQQFALMAGVSESLAGRVAVYTLLPMALAEQLRAPERGPFTKHRGAPPPEMSAVALARRMLRGGWPELVAHPRIDGARWHQSYLQTYLERDVRSLRAIGDLHAFSTFLRALAARNAQLLSLTELARDLGVVQNTVKAWLGVLEASHVVAVVQPFFRNLTKRLVKTPKVYFLDTGLVASLLAIESPRALLAGPAAGALLETFVLGELYRAFLHRGREPRVTFFRTATGDEVDFIVELDGKLHPIEVKLTATPTARHADGIARFADALGADVAPGRVVCLVPTETALTRTCRAVPAWGFAVP